MSRRAPRAQSRYRQVRITITEETGGWLTVRIMVKPLAEDWTFRHTVWHHRFRQEEPSVHWLDMVATAYDVVVSEVLPPPK